MGVSSEAKGVVTWQEAEEALLAAVEYLGALPDRERGFLSAGSRSGWPEIVRSVRDGDYGAGQGVLETEVAPSARLTRRHVDQVERMLIGERPCADAIPAGHRRMVGRVLVMKLWAPGGVDWAAVWQAEGGKASGLTSDTHRKRYDRAVGKVAAAMEVR